MTWPASKLAQPDRDAIAAACSYRGRCLTLAVQVVPDGTIYEWRRPLDGGRDIMLVYEPDDAPWLVELSAAEATEVCEKGVRDNEARPGPLPRDPSAD